MAVIFYFSSLPGDELDLPGFRFSDKVAHFAAFFLLGWLLSMRHSLRRRLTVEASAFPPAPDLLALAVGCLYGLSDEIHQYFVPLREFALADWAADSLGVVAALWLHRILVGRKAGLAAG